MNRFVVQSKLNGDVWIDVTAFDHLHTAKLQCMRVVSDNPFPSYFRVYDAVTNEVRYRCIRDTLTSVIHNWFYDSFVDDSFVDNFELDWRKWGF